MTIIYLKEKTKQNHQEVILKHIPNRLVPASEENYLENVCYFFNKNPISPKKAFMSPEPLFPASKYEIHESKRDRTQSLFLSLCHTVLQALKRKDMDMPSGCQQILETDCSVRLCV